MEELALLVALAVAGLILGAPIALAIGLARLRRRLDDVERSRTLGDDAARITRLEAQVRALQAEVERTRTAPAAGAAPAPPTPAAPEEPRPPASPAGQPSRPAAPEAPLPPVVPSLPPTPTPRAAARVGQSAAQAPRVPPVRPSPAPSFSNAMRDLDGLIDRARAWLFGGNTVVRAGVIVLFFGVAFFLNYAIDRGWIPIVARLSAAAAGGLALTGVGWRLRGARRDFALAIQGGGVGIVYLTVFAAVNLYDLIDAGLGMPLMVVLVALAGALAVLQDSRGLAVLATAGGFLAPVLVSSGGTHVGLFGYYLVLDLGILAIAWFKAWRALNLLGFAFTFGIGSLWGARFYRPEHFASTEPFLIAFFLLYVAVPILFAERTAGTKPPTPAASPPMPVGRGLVDGSLVFGVPLIAFGLQHALVRDIEYGLAFSALAMAIFYAAVGTILWRRRAEVFRLVVEVFVSLAVGFGTLAIPLAVDARWTGAAWALEGAGLVWVGVRQQQRLARLAGLALQLAAAVAYVRALELPAGGVPVLNGAYLGAVLVSLAGLSSARHLRRVEHPLSVAALWWGLAWWFVAGFREIDATTLPIALRDQPYLLFSAASLAVVGALRHRLEWRDLSFPGVLLLAPIMVLAAVAPLVGLNVAGGGHPLTLQGGLVAWVAAFAVHLWLLRRMEDDWPAGLTSAWHTGTLWLGVFLLTSEVTWAVGQTVRGGAAWEIAAWSLVPLAAMAAVPALILRSHDRGDWPLARYGDAYLAGLWPIAVLTAVWMLSTSVLPGDPAPLPYVPMANPLELMQAIALLVLLRWPSARWTPIAMPVAVRWSICAWLGFVALNGIVARSIHVFGGVPFDAWSLWGSAPYQMAVSITWTLLALVVMVLATRAKQRLVWVVGAVLLGAVVVKLFAVDLDGTGTVARFVSFLVVGTLMLLIGYLSPLPPRALERPS